MSNIQICDKRVFAQIVNIKEKELQMHALNFALLRTSNINRVA